MTSLVHALRNAVDLDEYPASQAVHNRCVSMSTFFFIDGSLILDEHLVTASPDLSNVPLPCSRASLEGAFGDECDRNSNGRVVGSYHAGWPGDEEALAGGSQGSREGPLSSQYCALDLDFLPSDAQEKLTSFDSQVFGANAQVALEKFARYWDVEARLVPVTEESDFVMDPKRAISLIDENTIGVMIIMGSTYTGHFENVQLMNDLRKEFALLGPISLYGF